MTRRGEILSEIQRAAGAREALPAHTCLPMRRKLSGAVLCDCGRVYAPTDVRYIQQSRPAKPSKLTKAP